MKKPRKQDITEEAAEPPPPLRPGKDEMNFAEFPIALLTDRVPKGQKVIKFEDKIYDEKRKRIVTRRRIIEGSEEYGLPTATDDLVILALIQLAKQKGDFASREVEFTRLELIKLLGWADEGRSYDRIKLSLLRIKGVNYVYDNAWWDGRQKMWTTRAFNIIDNVEINDSRTSYGQGGLFTSRIVWNEVVFDSFQAGFLRDIDFHLCVQLEHPIALRMYRFLGKRFYVRHEWEFELKEFAYEHMGLGRNYEGGTQIARKLRPAIVELEDAGFLEKLSDTDRFIKKGREWSIRFIQKSAPALVPLPPATPEMAPDHAGLAAELTQRGVAAKAASELVKQHPAEAIRLKIEVFDWLVEKKDKRVEKSPAGFLVTSINDDFAPPKDFVSKAERQQAADAKRAGEKKADAERRRRQTEAANERKNADAVAAYRKGLSPTAMAQLEADAIAAANEELRDSLNDPTMAMFKNTLRARIIDEFILRRLQDPQNG